jgi:integrase
MAQQALAAVARGEDPQLERQQRKAAATVKALWERFDAEQLPLKKTQTQYDYRNLWRGVLQPKFGAAKVASISRNDVDRFHKSMRQTPYQANRALALLGRLMSLAEIWALRPQGTNPCSGIERFTEQPKTRYLSKSELGRISDAMSELLGEEEISLNAVHAIELLLLTGARLNEILKAEWAWVDRQRQVLNLPDSKTGAKPVYLSSMALDVLARQEPVSLGKKHIFSSHVDGKHFTELRKPWRKICERAAVDGARLHDLRHTAASIAVGQGASLAIIGKLLGHSQTQTTQRYAHVDLDPALKAANELGAAVARAMTRIMLD